MSSEGVWSKRGVVINLQCSEVGVVLCLCRFVAELAERYEDDERTYLDTAALTLPTMYSEHRKRSMACCSGGNQA